MRLLDGDELVGYIKERQAKQVRGLKQAAHIYPKLAIIDREENPAASTYIQKLQAYAADIQVDVDTYESREEATPEQLLNKLSNDRAVHGIVMQGDVSDVPADKDVAGLSAQSPFDAATPMAVLWLLAGYGIDLPGKDIVVLGSDSPVGGALMRMLEASGSTVRGATDSSDLTDADIVLTTEAAAGAIGVKTLRENTVVVDVTESAGAIAADVYDRTGGAATPQGSGLGELAIAALFDNLLRAARQAAGSEGSV